MRTEHCIPLSTPAIANPVGIDGALICSMQNHRLYRQNRVYRMKVDLNPLAQDSNGNFGQVHVYKLSDTWLTSAAHREALAAYMNAKMDEIAFLKARGQPLPRWRDFRTSLGGMSMAWPETYGFANGALGVLQTDSSLPGTANADFETSTVQTTTGARSFAWTANGTTSLFDIMEQFQEVYNVEDTPESQNTMNRTYDVIEGDNTKAFDGVNETELDDLSGDGDEPPYDKVNVPQAFTLVKKLGIQNFDYSGVGANSEILRVNSTGFFDAPLGIVVLHSPDSYFTDVTHGDVCIEFAKGSYKGVKAEPYSRVRFNKDLGIYVGA